MKARIQYKTKPETVWNGDIKEQWIKIPQGFTRSHCNMEAFRSHRKYGAYANSDLFPAMLGRIKEQVFGGKQWIKPSDSFEGVTIDTSGFLAVVTVEVPD